jgi:hypothetical protein
MRVGKSMQVRLYRVPGLEKIGEWTVPGDYAEVANTRCRDKREGDLYLHVGVSHDKKGINWTHALYHLEGKELRSIADGMDQSSLFLDLDGDGCPDPMVVDKKAARILINGKWRDVPVDFDPLSWQGLDFSDSQSAAIDLDGDGDLDVLTGHPPRVIDINTQSVVWTHHDKDAFADLITWENRPAIAIRSDDRLYIIAADATHRVITDLTSKIYVGVLPGLDPAGDGSTLAVSTLKSGIITALEPNRLIELGFTFSAAADDRMPRLGPVRIDDDNQPDLLGVRILEPGSPMLAFPGSESKYDLILTDPPGTGTPRVIRHVATNGEAAVRASLVDLNGSGKYQIIVDESTIFSSCDMKSNGSTSTLMLLDGNGGVLWRDEPRTEYFSGGRNADMKAHARPLELSDDGRLSLRIRAAGEEWYIVPSDAAVPKAIPPCLE